MIQTSTRQAYRRLKRAVDPTNGRERKLAKKRIVRATRRLEKAREQADG